MDCNVSVSGVSANVQSWFLKRDISYVSAFCVDTPKLCLTPLCVCARQLSVCAWGSICTRVVMDGMCDMCRSSGMPGTSGLLNTGPGPIEMAYQWRYIWKNSLPMQSLTTPCQTERKKSLSCSPSSSPLFSSSLPLLSFRSLSLSRLGDMLIAV